MSNNNKITNSSGSTFTPLEKNPFAEKIVPMQANLINRNSINNVMSLTPNLKQLAIEETNNQLSEINNKLENQTQALQSELQKIQYENKLINAQLQTANITIDRQSDELEKLRSINSELKMANQALENNQKHHIRNSFLLAIVTGIVLLGIEHWYDIYNFILHLIDKG